MESWYSVLLFSLLTVVQNVSYQKVVLSTSPVIPLDQAIIEPTAHYDSVTETLKTPGHIRSKETPDLSTTRGFELDQAFTTEGFQLQEALTTGYRPEDGVTTNIFEGATTEGSVLGEGTGGFEPGEGGTTEQPTALLINFDYDGTEEIDEDVSTPAHTRVDEGTEEIDEDSTPCGAENCAVTQCNKIECWCALLGEEVLGTRRGYNATLRYTIQCEALSGPTQCLLEYERQAGYEVMVNCDEQGRYHANQCHPEGYCFCVDEVGREVPGTKQSWPSPTVECYDLEGLSTERVDSLEQPCAEARTRQLTAQRSASYLVYIAQCNVNGAYVTEQCHENSCWCVGEQYGTKVEGTEHARYGDMSTVCSTATGPVCSNNMIWKQRQSSCNPSCEDPAPGCKGDIARCACPLSAPILQGERCVTLAACHEMKKPTECPVAGMSHAECTCQPTCDNPVCTGCRSICVCDDNKVLLEGECVSVEQCPPQIDTSGCTNGMHYELCGDPCPMTCRDPFPECGGSCVEGCYCPADKPLLHNGSCVISCPKEELTPCQYERIQLLYPDTNQTSQSLPSRCAKDGSYLPLQCSWEECWCVTLSGTRVATVETTMDDSVCDKIERKVERECNSTTCWCLSTKGKEVAGTHRPVELGIVCEESQGEVIHSTKCSREPCQWVDPLSGRCSVPQCDTQGGYVSTQCKQSFCWCVDRTGDVLSDTYRSSDAGLDCATKLTPCEAAAQDPDLLVTCDSLGNYSPMVCQGTECWCVDQMGVELMGTRGHLSDVKCPKRTGFCPAERGPAVSNEFPFIGTQYPKCNRDGNYVKTQYKDGEYYCVDEISGGFITRGSKCGVTECKDRGLSVYLDYFKENVVLDVEELRDCYCQEEACEDTCYNDQKEYNITIEGYTMQIKLPLCSNNGLYFPRQCMGDPALSDRCYCVDVYTGAEIANSRGTFNNLPCPNTGVGQALYNSLRLPACLKNVLERVAGITGPRDYFTCTNGLYNAKQCKGGQCGCVAMDTGIPLVAVTFPGNSSRECGEVLESACWRMRSEECEGDELVLAGDCSAATCTSDGHYSPLQCTTELCYCVSIDSGEEVPFTHGARGMFTCTESGVIEDDRRTACEVQRDERCGAEYHDSTEDGEFVCRVDECNEQGDYMSKQCWGDTCHCVNLTTGAKLSNDGYSKDVIICTDSGDMIFTNVTNCQIEELQRCSKVFYEEMGLYFRPLSCPQPLCTADGLYNPNSCMDDECHCVNVTTGQQIPGTSHTFGKEVCTSNGTLTPDTRHQCELDRARVCELQYVLDTWHTPPDCPALYCTDTGLFNPLQCGDDSCWCCNVGTGEEYIGTRGERGSFDCDYRGNIIDILTPTSCVNQSALTCDGVYYNRVQCNKEYCYCVYLDTGLPIRHTETVLGRPRCEALLDRRGPCQTYYDTLCPLVFSQGMFQVRAGCYDEQCDSQGLYNTMRCTDALCHCVNSSTGALVPGTEGLQGTFYCSVDSAPVTIPPCRRQKDLQCTSDGLFEPTQCGPFIAGDAGDGCYCVYTDSGDRILQDTACGAVYDTRGPCVKERDATCEGEEGCLKCDEQGNYQVHQCIGDTCFCADSGTGELLISTNDPALHCNQQGDLIWYTPCNEQTELECTFVYTGYNTYHPKQCVSRFCYCVYTDSGQEIPGSRSFDRYMSCDSQHDAQTRCQREAECGYVINEERSGFIQDPECGAVSCESDGSYSTVPCSAQSSKVCTAQGDFEPRQCLGNICFCVNITTGAVFPATLTNGGSFYCTVSGDKLEKSHCQSQDVYRCDVQGYYEPRQCQEEGQCECLFKDTGKLNYRSKPCHQTFDNRTSCQQLRDEQCPWMWTEEGYVEREGCPGIECRTDGSFSSKQCSRVEAVESCYCIDRWSGRIGERPVMEEDEEEYYEEAVEFNCTESGEMVVLTKCRTQSVLECDITGDFISQQIVDNTMVCVYTNTGDVIQELGAECEERRDERKQCERERDHACPWVQNGQGSYSRPTSCPSLTCRSSGDYTPVQCTNTTCYCVHGATGDRVDQSEGDSSTFRCDEEGTFILLTACERQSELECDPEGSFTPHQCTGNVCYCVYTDSGVPVHGSGMWGECIVQTDKRTLCQTTQDQMCPRGLEEGAEEGCGEVWCEEDGSFSPQQCTYEACYCADIQTGQLIPGTEGAYDTFLCTISGDKLPLTKCRRQSVLQCTDTGLYHSEQYDGVRHYCVYTDSGYPILERSAPCPVLLDTRSECQLARDLGCHGEGQCQIMECTEDGQYAVMQCGSSQCYCVDSSTGEGVGAAFRPASHWCDHTGARPITMCKAQSLLQCDGDGNFIPTQCNTHFCYCVYIDTGDIIEETESLTDVSCGEEKEGRTRCKIEQYNSCPKYLIPGTEEMRALEDCVRTRCDEGGLFYPMKCLGERCFCTDVHEGGVIEGTVGTKGAFTCSTHGLMVYPTVCQAKRIDYCGLYFNTEGYSWVLTEPCLQYTCDLQGLFVTKQCIDQQFCWCVEPGTGEETPGTQGMSCSMSCNAQGGKVEELCPEDRGETKCQQQSVFECDYEGSFYPYQEANNTGICIFSDTGLYIPHSELFRLRVAQTDQCPTLADNRGQCLVERYERCEKSWSDEGLLVFEQDCHRPECGNDELYKVQQCHYDQCWCVDRLTGEQISQPSPDPDMDCQIDKSCSGQSVLECEHGQYKARQCYHRFCACVYANTGQIIWGTLGSTHCNTLYDTRGECLKRKQSTCPQHLLDITGRFDVLPGCVSDDECDFSKLFISIYCQGSKCMCVDPYDGTLLYSTEGPRDTFTCDTRGNKVLVNQRVKTKCQKEGIEQCTVDGWYPSPDCTDGVCYCVYADSGAAIYGTELEGSLPRCKEVFDNRTVCHKYNEEQCPHQYLHGSLIIPDDCEQLHCSANGTFLPNQCFDNHCFCVNVTTGAALPNVYGEAGRFECDEFGNVHILPTKPPTVCQSQMTLSCDTEGDFFSRQCNNTICFCVYADTGRVVVDSYTTIWEVSDMGCAFMLDQRTDCEIQRDEACPPLFNYDTFSFEGPEECFPPRCRSDGSYRPMQCYSPYECSCVKTFSGEVIPGSTSPVGELLCAQEFCTENSCKCLDERGRYMSLIASPPCVLRLGMQTCSEKRKQQLKIHSKYLVSCVNDNRYELMQCYKEKLCWCVDPFTGVVTPNTVGPPGTVHCRYDPPCVRQQKLEIEAAVSVDGFYPISMYSITQCEPDGTYYPRQCNMLTKECWCVDEDGVSIKGTRFHPWMSDVKCARILPPNVAQRKPKAKVQCPGGTKPVFCYKNSCRGKTCLAAPSASCLQYKCGTCQDIFYDPKTYHPVSCLYHKLSCQYLGTTYAHGEEFEMGCYYTCYCYQGSLRCRPRCMLQNRPPCEDAVVVQDPLDVCCKVYACRDKGFMNSSISIYDDLQSKVRRSKKRRILHHLD